VESETNPPPAPGWSAQQPAPYGTGHSSQPDDRWRPPPPAPQPGVIPLRPLQVGEILGAAIEYVRRNPAAVIGVSAMVGVIAALSQLAVLAFGSERLRTAQLDPATVTLDQVMPLVWTIAGMALAQGIIIGILQVMGSGMLAHIVGRSTIGKHTSFAQSWQLVRPQLVRLVLATVLVGLFVGGAAVLPILPGLALITTVGGPISVVVLIIGIVIATATAVWVSFTLVLSTTAIALENCGAWQGLKRSASLVRGAFWRTLAVVLLGTIVGQAVGAIVAAPLTFIGSGGGELSTGSLFAMALGTMVTMVVALPFISGVTALVYIDRRMRTDNLAELLLAASQRPDSDLGH